MYFQSAGDCFLAECKLKKKSLIAWNFLFILMFSSAISCLGSQSSRASFAVAQENPKPAEHQDYPIPGMAELSLRASQVEEKANALEKELGQLFDLPSAERRLTERRNRLAELAARFKRLGSSDMKSYEQLSEIRGFFRLELDALRSLGEGVSNSLGILDSRRREWTGERENWALWRSAIPEDSPIQTLGPMFAEVGRAIDRATGFLTKNTAIILEFQRKLIDVQNTNKIPLDEIEALIEEQKVELFRRSAPPMFSNEYFLKFGDELRSDLRGMFKNVSFPDAAFFSNQGLIALFQCILALVVFYAIRSKKELLSASAKWRFLSARPLTVGLLIGVSSLFPLYGQTPQVWRLILWTIVAVSAGRLIGGQIIHPWKRRLVYFLAALFISTQALRLLGLPRPLFRLYVAIIAGLGMPLCFWRANESVRRGDSFLYTFALRLGGAVLGVVLAVQLAGFNSLATHLLDSSIKTTFLVLLFRLIVLLAHGGLEFVIGSPAAQKIHLIRHNSLVIVKRLGHVADFAVWTMAMALILEIWRIYESPAEAVHGILSFGIVLGEQRVTLGLAMTAALFLYGSFLVSSVVQAILMDEILPRRHVELGSRISIARLVHYAFVLIGFFLAIGVLGVELKNLTILAGAFGIGIGFGLQTIVNNFVSGLILLFERPIKVGDVVQLGETWGKIKKLGLRATVVETFDNSEVIVPNSDLVSTQVTNWTLSDRASRLVLKVGTAYGSDVPLVLQILHEAAEANPMILKDPSHQAFFMGFGESSLDFELRAWVADIDNRFKARSEINQEIDRKFREFKVEIPFPQRDLHLRSVDKGVALKYSEANKLELARESSLQTDKFE